MSDFDILLNIAGIFWGFVFFVGGGMLFGQWITRKW